MSSAFFDRLLFLATQATAPPLPGEVIPGAPSGGLEGPAPSSGAGDMSFIYIIILMMVGMIALSMLGSRKERKKREALLSNIRKHDTVQTIGGVIGAVVEVKPDTVVLKVDEMSNTRMTFARSAIQQILKESKEPKEARAGADR